MALDGKRIRELRLEQKLSLRVLAALVTDRTGKTVSAQALEKVEADGLDLSVEKSVALASTLGVGISDICKHPEAIHA